MTALQDIARERARQKEIGFDDRHDDLHGLPHLLRHAAHRLAGARYIRQGFPAAARRRLVATAAMLVAAIEYIDRHPALTADETLGEE